MFTHRPSSVPPAQIHTSTQQFCLAETLNNLLTTIPHLQPSPTFFLPIHLSAMTL